MRVTQTVFKGTWEEALNDPHALPPNTEILIIKYEDIPNEPNELDGKTLAEVFKGRLGALSFEPLRRQPPS